MNPQAASFISLAQWVPVLHRWLGLRHALVVGHSQQADSLLSGDPQALTLFKGGSPVATPAASPAAHAQASYAAAHTLPWLIAEHTGTTTFHQASLPSESGLLPASALTSCWPGIKPLSQYQASALSLDDAWAQASAEHAWASQPQWLWIGCLPATALLRGAIRLLQQTDVVALRVQLHPEAHSDANLHGAQFLLQTHGFALCGVEPERNPHLGTALFVRDYPAAHSATRQQRDQLTQSHGELQARLSAETRAKEAEAGAKAEAQRQRDELAQAHAELHARLSAEIHAKQTEAEIRVAAQQQVQSLVQATEQALAQTQTLLQEKNNLETTQSQLAAQLQTLEQAHKTLLNRQTRVDDRFIAAEAQIDLFKQLILADRMKSESSITEEDLCLELDPNVPPNTDLKLLQRVITQWQFGDWQSLAQLDLSTFQHHPDRAALALYAAAGQQQIGDIELTLRFIRMAQVWGCDPIHIKRVLISGLYNSLGRIAAELGHNQRSQQHFETAIDTGSPEADRLVKKARIEFQLHQLVGKSN
jgi:hypothetical protein